MNPILRWTLLPFILMLLLSFIVLGIFILNFFGFAPQIQNLLTQNMAHLGFIGKIIWAVILIDMGLIISFLFLSIPSLFIIKDIKRKLVRYGIIGHKNFSRFKGSIFEKRAKQVFRTNKNVKIYIYGHTHRKSLEHINGRIIINTGTWLRRVYRVDSKYVFLPDIFYSKIDLSYFIISAKNNKITVESKTWPKKFKPKLTIIEKMFISLRKSNKQLEKMIKKTFN